MIHALMVGLLQDLDGAWLWVVPLSFFCRHFCTRFSKRFLESLYRKLLLFVVRIARHRVGSARPFTSEAGPIFGICAGRRRGY